MAISELDFDLIFGQNLNIQHQQWENISKAIRVPMRWMAMTLESQK